MTERAYGVEDEDVVLYALDALDPREHAAVETRLAEAGPTERERLDSLVRSTRETMARHSEVHAEPAPPELRRRVLAAVRGGTSPLDDRRRRRDRDLRSRPALPTAVLAAAAIALLAGLGIGRYVVPETPVQPQVAAPREPSETEKLLGPLELRVTRAATTSGVPVTLLTSRPADCAVISFDGLSPAPVGRTYQLWLMPATGDPRSAGLLSADPAGGRSMHSMVDLGDARQVGVTVEPAGGSAAPTSPVLGTVHLG